MLRIFAHVLLLALAIVVSFLGFVVGIVLNLVVGTALWIAAAAIVVLHIMWLVKDSGTS